MKPSISQELTKTLSSPTEFKKTVFMGKEFKCPTWANYIAADADGHVYAYAAKPARQKGNNYEWFVNNNDTRVAFVGKIAIEPIPLQVIK